jgi:hypothetical protein
MILEEFIHFIESIGFKLVSNPLCVEGNTSFDFSYNGYNIHIVKLNLLTLRERHLNVDDLTETRFGLEHNLIGIIDSPSRTNQRNFDLSDLELLEIHFKSEIRNMKLNELGI